MLLHRTILGLAIVATLPLSCKDKPADNVADAAPAPIASLNVPDAAATAPATSGSSARRDADRRGHGGGPIGMLFQAALALDLKPDLKPEQKLAVEAAEKISSAEEATEREAIRSATKDLNTQVVAGVKAGKIDSAKLEPSYAAIEKASAATHAKEGEALVALHKALDPAQRKAVVAAVRAKQTARDEEFAKFTARQSDAGDGGKPKMPGEHTVERLLSGIDGLGIDAEQQKKIDALSAKDDGPPPWRPNPAEMKKRVEALLTEFEKDELDAKKANPFDAKKVRGPLEQDPKVLAQLLPILKPEQREKVAAKMEAMRMHGHRNRPHRPGDDDDAR